MWGKHKVGVGETQIQKYTVCLIFCAHREFSAIIFNAVVE